MSIITTTYTETLTIITDDNGAQTIERSSSAHTSTAYLFNELSEEAKARAINDAIAEEDRDYCESGIYGASQTGMSAAEIWGAAEDLEKAQPVIFRTDQGGTPYGTARRYGWSGIRWEVVTEQQHTGICYSMDICDAWNAYAARIVALQDAHEEAEDRAYIHTEAAAAASGRYHYTATTDAERESARQVMERELSRAEFYDHMAERIEETAEELTEEAARAVGNTIDFLIESERDYYTSAEFWAKWLEDGEARFTREGERI